eukprot:3288603-Pyramimonas_sp.AAC.1
MFCTLRLFAATRRQAKEHSWMGERGMMVQEEGDRIRQEVRRIWDREGPGVRDEEDDEGEGRRRQDLLSPSSSSSPLLCHLPPPS